MADIFGNQLHYKEFRFEFPRTIEFVDAILGDLQSPLLTVDRLRLTIDWQKSIAQRRLVISELFLAHPVVAVDETTDIAWLSTIGDARLLLVLSQAEMLLNNGRIVYRTRDGQMDWRKVTLAVTGGLIGSGSRMIGEGTVTGDFREKEFSGKLRLEFAAGADAGIAATADCSELTVVAADTGTPLRLRDITMKLNTAASDTVVTIAAGAVEYDMLTLFDVAGAFSRNNTVITGQVGARRGLLQGGAIGRSEAYCTWEPDVLLRFDTMVVHHGQGVWRGTWHRIMGTDRYLTRLEVSAASVPAAAVLTYLLPETEGNWRGELNGVIRCSFDRWRRDRYPEGEACWWGDSLTALIPEERAVAVGLIPAEDFRELAGCSVALVLRGTPRQMVASSMLLRHDRLAVQGSGYIAGDGRLALQAQAVLSPASSRAFWSACGARQSQVADRQLSLGWQIQGTRHGVRWQWQDMPTPVGEADIPDWEPYLAEPGFAGQWSAEWKKMEAFRGTLFDALAAPAGMGVAVDIIQHN